ncbi:hypothetical protein DFH07DRAFT_873038, partial [Mycena maculata]
MITVRALRRKPLEVLATRRYAVAPLPPLAVNPPRFVPRRNVRGVYPPLKLKPRQPGGPGRPRIYADDERAISTLDPARLLASDLVDMRGFFQYPLQTPSSDSICQLGYICLAGKSLPFPPDARGFLYLHADSATMRLRSASVRLRLARDPSPAAFQAGRDLAMPDGKPWCVKLARINHSMKYEGVRQLLERDGLLRGAAEVEDSADSEDEGAAAAFQDADAPAAPPSSDEFPLPPGLPATLDPARLCADDLVDLGRRGRIILHGCGGW